MFIISRRNFLLLWEGKLLLGARRRQCTAPSPVMAFPRRARLQLPFLPGILGAVPQRVAPTAPLRTRHPSFAPKGPPEGEKSLPPGLTAGTGVHHLHFQLRGWFLNPSDKSQPRSGWKTQTAPRLYTFLPNHAPSRGPGSLRAQVAFQTPQTTRTSIFLLTSPQTC